MRRVANFLLPSAKATVIQRGKNTAQVRYPTGSSSRSNNSNSKSRQVRNGGGVHVRNRSVLLLLLLVVVVVVVARRRDGGSVAVPRSVVSKQKPVDRICTVTANRESCSNRNYTPGDSGTLGKQHNSPARRRGRTRGLAYQTNTHTPTAQGNNFQKASLRRIISSSRLEKRELHARGETAQKRGPVKITVP